MLTRLRHQWVTASATSVLSEDCRAAQLTSIADQLTAARRMLRAGRQPDLWGELEQRVLAAATKTAAGQVIRRFQHYTSEQRADHASSHRLGHQQRKAVGEYFYTHPGVPGRAFSTRTQAAEAAVRTSTTHPTTEKRDKTT